MSSSSNCWVHRQLQQMLLSIQLCVHFSFTCIEQFWRNKSSPSSSSSTNLIATQVLKQNFSLSSSNEGADSVIEQYGTAVQVKVCAVQVVRIAVSWTAAGKKSAVVQLKTWPVSSYISWMVFSWALKLYGGSWQTSTGKVFHSPMHKERRFGYMCLCCTGSVCSWFQTFWCGPQ